MKLISNKKLKDAKDEAFFDGFKMGAKSVESHIDEMLSDDMSSGVATYQVRLSSRIIEKVKKWLKNRKI